MNDLEKSRLKINEIDDKMIELFKERLKAVDGVVRFKIDNDLPVLDSSREKEIILKNIKKLNNPLLDSYYLDFFSGVLKSSKDYQKNIITKGYRFALIGSHIGYTYSPLIHNLFYKRNNLNANYSILDIEESDLEYTLHLLKIGKYHGFNVTIPYKKSVMRFLDVIDPSAKKIGAVNTIVCRNNKLIGYNTDYYGFKDLLEKNKVIVKEKSVFILGTGGAALCVKAVVEDLGGKATFVSRTLSKNNIITYKDFYDRSDVDVIVNTTPMGTYPDISEAPLNSDYDFNGKVVVDIIYNPKRTTLLKRSGSRINGLYMLFSQAVKADNIFLDKEYPLSSSLFNEVEGVVNCE